MHSPPLPLCVSLLRFQSFSYLVVRREKRNSWYWVYLKLQLRTATIPWIWKI